MPNHWERIKGKLWKAALAVVVVVLHTVVSGVIICCMWGMEHLILILWSVQENEPSLAGVSLHTLCWARN
jgi:hypothetical protein